MHVDARALAGFIIIVVFFGNAIVIVRRGRRSGRVQDHGHPLKDQLLLLASGIVVAGALFVVLWWLGPRTPPLRTLSGQVLTFTFLGVAAGVSWFANSLLRRRR